MSIDVAGDKHRVAPANLDRHRKELMLYAARVISRLCARAIRTNEDDRFPAVLSGRQFHKPLEGFGDRRLFAKGIFRCSSGGSGCVGRWSLSRPSAAGPS